MDSTWPNDLPIDSTGWYLAKPCGATVSVDGKELEAFRDSYKNLRYRYGTRVFRVATRTSAWIYLVECSETITPQGYW